jgi:tRNA-specific 2-thiouridylase
MRAQHSQPAVGWRLLRAADREKDQSYVLFGLRRELLPHILFPLAGYRKEQIRRLARRLDLPVAEKPDSQEICFVAPGSHGVFVRSRRPQAQTAGQVVDTSGRVVGRHGGIENFTVGQRRGLGVAMGSPRYVVALNPQLRQVTIGTRDELLRSSLEVDRLNWLIDEPAGPLACQVQIRYRHAPGSAMVEPLEHSQARVTFDQPQCGIAPGQAAVFYDGEHVLGGGWIC